MSRRACVLAATVVLAACPSPPTGPQHPARPDDRAVRIRIAQAEARRGGGLDELIELAARGDAHARALALRGLGRIGGAEATSALRAALRDPDPAITGAAAGALGAAALLDEPAPSVELTRALVEAAARAPAATRPIVIEAIGRAADASAQDALAGYLAGAPSEAEAAALALARHGRRALALAPRARAALIPLLSSDPPRRYAATYALAREHAPGPAPAPLADALIARVADDVPETRAQAIAALARQDLVGPARLALVPALDDRDWRVAVEAARALAGARGTAEGADAVATALARRFDRIAAGSPADAHVVLEGLRVLGPHARRPLVAMAAAALATRAAAARGSNELASGWIACRAQVVLMRGADAPDLSRIERCGLPDHLRAALAAELVADRIGDVGARRAIVARLLSHADARVRAAGLGALVALWPEGGTEDRRATIATVVAAIGAADPVLAGAALEVTPSLYDAIGAGDRVALDAAVIARGRAEHEPELAAAVLALIGTRALPAGAGACRAGLTGHPVRARAAEACLRALGEAVPARAVAAQTPPPLDVAAVIGTRPRWRLDTTAGEIVIALRPDVAPWAVAAIAELTRHRFYDGLELHRVVPGFVVQGGDPTGSGWGGPGFVLPAEPAAGEGAGFVAGGVGIADAGRDSGGSQWFVMHARAAHLDGRYTWIGQVEGGQATATALLPGARVRTATIELAAAAP